MEIRISFSSPLAYSWYIWNQYMLDLQNFPDADIPEPNVADCRNTLEALVGEVVEDVAKIYFENADVDDYTFEIPSEGAFDGIGDVHINVEINCEKELKELHELLEYRYGKNEFKVPLREPLCNLVCGGSVYIQFLDDE